MHVLCRFFDSVAVPALLQGGRCAGCRECILGSRVVELVHGSELIRMLVAAGALDFALAVLHWSPYGSVPPKDVLPLLAVLLLSARMHDKAEIRRTDYNALCALIAKTGADRTSAATIDGVLALQNIATNRDDVLRQLLPELSRLVGEANAARSTDARDPSPEVTSDVQWSSNNPQEDEEIAAVAKPRQDRPDPMRPDEVVCLFSRTLQAYFQADPTIPGVDEEKTRAMLCRHISSLRKAGAPPSAEKSAELAFQALRAWLLISRAAYHRKRYAHVRRKLVEREKTCVAWLLCIHRGRSGVACELIEGMANDVLSWLYWQRPAPGQQRTATSSLGSQYGSSKERASSAGAPSSRSGRSASNPPGYKNRTLSRDARDRAPSSKESSGGHSLPQSSAPSTAAPVPVTSGSVEEEAAKFGITPPTHALDSWTVQLDDALFAGAQKVQDACVAATRALLTPHGAAYVALLACLVVFLNQLARALGWTW
jgi:hypothetical protein